MPLLKLLPGLAAVSLLSSPALAAPPRPTGPEIAVNVASQGSHQGALPALFSDGSFVVVWTDHGQKDAVHARLFRRDGAPASGEFRLTAASTSSSSPTSVVVDRDDSFLVAWDDTPPGKPTRVLVERFSRTGRALGPAFQVHARSPQARSGGRLALRPGGGFAVAWSTVEDHVTHTDDVGDIYALDVYARAFTAAGTPLGPEFLANDETYDEQILDDFTVTPDGVFVVVYDSWEAEVYTLRMRRLTPRGRPLGPETGVSSELPDGPTALGMMSLSPDGSFTIAWSGIDLTNVLSARRFAADGSPLTADFFIGRSTGERWLVVGDLAGLPDGGFVAIWSDEAGLGGNGPGIFGRAFGPDGAPRTGALRLNRTTTGDQFGPALAGRDGRFVAVWGQAADPAPSSPSKVRARLLSSN